MRKGDERKAALLKASKELFFTRGYAATSINDILDTQHISKGSFYHHFESKLEVLTELCRQHQAEAAERYRAVVKADMPPLRRLDLLLYHALPAIPEETQMCALLLQLHRTPEGDQVISAMLDAQRTAFFGLFSGLLRALAKQDEAYLPFEALPELAWDMYTSLYRHVLSLGLDYATDRHPAPPMYADEAQLLGAMRYLLERTLDLPFGSLTIIRAETLRAVLLEAADIAKAAHQAAGAAPDGDQISLFSAGRD